MSDKDVEMGDMNAENDKLLEKDLFVEGRFV